VLGRKTDSLNKLLTAPTVLGSGRFGYAWLIEQVDHRDRILEKPNSGYVADFVGLNVSDSKSTPELKIDTRTREFGSPLTLQATSTYDLSCRLCKGMREQMKAARLHRIIEDLRIDAVDVQEVSFTRVSSCREISPVHIHCRIPHGDDAKNKTH
jgi:ABC-type proline/glycine betaine transport system ATPase subunit